jgi:hypothetical protein
MERESDPLFRFARKYSEAFDIVAIGSGNDTGAGSDTVTFYNITEGQLERKTRQDCPATYDGLRVESTR